MNGKPSRKFLMKGICRIDQESKKTFGWYVRVSHKGKALSKYFADKKNGGKNAALLSAQSWRNAMWLKYGKAATGKHVVTVPHKANNTGVVGVRYNEKLNRFDISWVTPEGKQSKTSVSVRKWGEQEAFKRACEIRVEKEKERVST